MATERELVIGLEYYLDSTRSITGKYIGLNHKDEVLFDTDGKGYYRDKDGYVTFPVEEYNYKPVKDEKPN